MKDCLGSCAILARMGGDEFTALLDSLEYPEQAARFAEKLIERMSIYQEIDGLEERLKSRFGWGLTVAVEPPELETRVAILMKKAEQSRIDLPADVAFFVAQRIKSNVRELEGALKRVIASSQFTNRRIDIELV